MYGGNDNFLPSRMTLQAGLSVAIFGLMVGVPVVLLAGVPIYVFFRDRIERKRAFCVVLGATFGLVVAAVGVSLILSPLVLVRSDFLDVTGRFYLSGALSGAIGGLVFAGFVFARKNVARLSADV